LRSEPNLQLRNNDWYMLKKRLNEIELHFLERRLSEERFAMEMLRFMSPLTKKKGSRPPALNSLAF